MGPTRSKRHGLFAVRRHNRLWAQAMWKRIPNGRASGLCGVPAQRSSGAPTDARSGCDFAATEDRGRAGVLLGGPKAAGPGRSPNRGPHRPPQEFFLVDQNCQPAPVAPQILEASEDPHLPPELGRFNLEFKPIFNTASEYTLIINRIRRLRKWHYKRVETGDPQTIILQFRGDCLGKLERQLNQSIENCGHPGGALRGKGSSHRHPAHADHVSQFNRRISFEQVKSNFLVAARSGLDEQVSWLDGKILPAADSFSAQTRPPASGSPAATGSGGTAPPWCRCPRHRPLAGRDRAARGEQTDRIRRGGPLSTNPMRCSTPTSAGQLHRIHRYRLQVL